MTPKTPLKYARAPVCLSCALLLLAGCCGEKASSVVDSSQVQTVATGLINASECGCDALLLSSVLANRTDSFYQEKTRLSFSQRRNQNNVEY